MGGSPPLLFFRGNDCSADERPAQRGTRKRLGSIDVEALRAAMEGEVVGGMTPTAAARIDVYASNDKADSGSNKSDSKKKKGK